MKKTEQRVLERRAAKVLALSPQFDVARDQDMNACGTTKFCMISDSEWRAIRAVARAALKQAQEALA